MTQAGTDGRQMVGAFIEHEHEELIIGIDRIHEAAEGLASLPADRTFASVDKVLRWIDEALKPHVAWEEAWLFPQVDAWAQTPWLTRMVRFDHRQIALQAGRLKMHQSQLDRGRSRETVVQVSSDLLGLETLLRANLEREEHFLKPLFELEADRWTSEWRS